MYTVNGEPRLTAKGHEVFAEMHDDSARVLREAAAEMPPEHPDAAELLGVAAGQDAASKGHLFRAAELRYDARGGMTAELERRRFEPGARWAHKGAGGAYQGTVERVHGNLVSFTDDQWFPIQRRATMTRENGWLFLDIGDAAGGHVPPGGWP